MIIVSWRSVLIAFPNVLFSHPHTFLQSICPGVHLIALWRSYIFLHKSPPDELSTVDLARRLNSTGDRYRILCRIRETYLEPPGVATREEALTMISNSIG